MAKGTPSDRLMPYLAPLILEQLKGLDPKTFPRALADEIKNLIISTDRTARAILSESPIIESGDLRYLWIEYKEESAPAWAPDGELLDIKNQIIVIVTKANMGTICSSDSDTIKRFAREVGCAQLLSRECMEKSFIGKRTRALWLNGIHAPTDIKPTAKTLMGSALEFAIDPLGDHSFYYSAARTEVSMQIEKGKPQKRIIGASPSSSKLWIMRPKSFREFLSYLEAIMDRASLKVGKKATRPFSDLAQSTSDHGNAKGAYALCLMPPEYQHQSSADEEKIDRFYQTEFSVQRPPSQGLGLKASVFFKGDKVGVLSLDITEDAGRLLPKPNLVAAAGHEKIAKIISDDLSRADQIKIYYNSGHVVTQGSCYRSGFQDLEFSWHFENLQNFNVDQEKPKPSKGKSLADAIGAKADKSLFAFVLEKFSQKGDWLICDDGAMEVADFIHISKNNTLTLIHVKASNTTKKGREASVAQYEIVTSQALKNLRHLDKAKLVAALEKGSNKQIASATWLSGSRQKNRDGFIKKLEGLEANHKKRLVIFQPQLTKMAHDNGIKQGRATPKVIRLRQLNTLMLSAKQSAMALGADFEAWASQ